MVFGQRTQLWWDLPVADGFDLLRDIYNVPDAQYRQTRNAMVDLMHLERLLDQPVRQLSLGQRMRCEIAAAMLHQPSILFLDEPTIGLDAPSKLAVREFVKTLNRERGVTVILTTHDMHDIEALFAVYPSAQLIQSHRDPLARVLKASSRARSKEIPTKAPLTAGRRAVSCLRSTSSIRIFNSQIRAPSKQGVATLAANSPISRSR